MSFDEKRETTVDLPPAEDTREKTLNRLKGSRVAIESFLDRYAESQAPRIDALAGIEWLDRIVGEAALGNFESAEIERWMSKHRDLAESSTLSEQDRKRISSLLLELQGNSTGGDGAGKESPVETDGVGAGELRRRFETWKERSGSLRVGPASQRVVSGEDAPRPASGALAGQSQSSTDGAVRSAPRKVILRRKSENADIGLFERFTEQVWAELDLLYQEFETGEHALSKLDQLLLYAEAKTDPMYLHLAGSLIYFLKIEGFRMAPYVERLRKAEKRFIGDPESR